MGKLAGLISTNYNSTKFGKLTSHRPIAAIPFGSRYLSDFRGKKDKGNSKDSECKTPPKVYLQLASLLFAEFVFVGCFRIHKYTPF